MPHGKSNLKHGQTSLGKALQRRRAHDRTSEDSTSAHDVDGSKARGKMTSVLEASNLEDFIASAMMSERAFESHKESTMVIGPDGEQMNLDANGEVTFPGASDSEDLVFDVEHMSLPRRPVWEAGMTAEELDSQERNAFLEWRRNIAKFGDSCRVAATAANASNAAKGRTAILSSRPVSAFSMRNSARTR